MEDTGKTQTHSDSDEATKRTLQTLMLVIIESNKLVLKAKFSDQKDDDKRVDLIKAYSKIYQNVLDYDSRVMVSRLITDSVSGKDDSETSDDWESGTDDSRSGAQ